MSESPNTIPQSRRPTRREARIAREAERALQHAAKSVRIREELKIPAREIRIGADPGSIFSHSMSWTIESADRCGGWSFGVERNWSQDVWDSQLHPKLSEWERLTWAEIDALTTGTKDRHKMHHSMDVAAICDEAQLRLMELNNSDESIFRFRMGGKPRLWGFRRVAVFHILWFDPTHQIYPVDP